MTLDLLSGTVSRSAYLDHNRKEIGDNQDDEKTENEKTENETVAFSKGNVAQYHPTHYLLPRNFVFNMTN